MKCRSHWPRYILMSIIGSYGTNIWFMVLLNEIVFKVRTKISEPWNIGQTELYWGQSSGQMEIIIQVWYFCITLSSFIRENQWTMKYRSQCPRMIKSNGMTYFYEIIFKLYGEIIQPYNIGHTDLDVFVCKSFCHIDIIIQVWQFSMK